MGDQDQGEDGEVEGIAGQGWDVVDLAEGYRTCGEGAQSRVVVQGIGYVEALDADNAVTVIDNAITVVNDGAIPTHIRHDEGGGWDVDLDVG